MNDKDYYSEYDDFLDELYGEIKIGYCIFLPSSILKELDPTAYRVGYNDFLDFRGDDNEGRNKKTIRKYKKRS